MEFGHREMSFEEADRRYEELRQHYRAGAVSDEELVARLQELMVQDVEGRWWAKSRETGEWMYYNGADWVVGAPQGYSGGTSGGGFSGSTQGGAFPGGARGDFTDRTQDASPSYDTKTWGSGPASGDAGRDFTSGPRTEGSPGGTWVGGYAAGTPTATSSSSLRALWLVLGVSCALLGFLLIVTYLLYLLPALLGIVFGFLAIREGSRTGGAIVAAFNALVILLGLGSDVLVYSL